MRRTLTIILSLVLGLITPLATANLSKGGFACASNSATTWKAGTNPTATWFAPGYDTTGTVANLTYFTAGIDRRAMIQALPMSDAGTYLLQLRARVSNTQQNVYWHVLAVTNNTTLVLTDGGIPETITQPGVKSLLKVNATANGNWISYSNSLTISAADAAAYPYVVVAIVASRKAADVAQFDDIYSTLHAVTTDPAAGITAEWYSRPAGITALTDINWSTPIKVSKEEQINWPDNSTVPFIKGVPNHTFAARFTGRIRIPTAGSWIFSVGADDGTSLVHNNITVLAADGQHSFTTRSVTSTMAVGTYPFELKYFENQGNHGLIFSWRGPGMTASEPIPSSAFLAPLRVVRWRPISPDDE